MPAKGFPSPTANNTSAASMIAIHLPVIGITMYNRTLAAWLRVPQATVNAPIGMIGDMSGPLYRCVKIHAMYTQQAPAAADMKKIGENARGADLPFEVRADPVEPAQQQELPEEVPSPFPSSQKDRSVATTGPAPVSVEKHVLDEDR